MSDLAVFILVFLLCCPARAAEPVGQESWRPTEQKCAAELEPQCHYANCEEWLAQAAAQCTVERLWPEKISHVQGCGWAAKIHDPRKSAVAQIIRCATGK